MASTTFLSSFAQTTQAGASSAGGAIAAAAKNVGRVVTKKNVANAVQQTRAFFDPAQTAWSAAKNSATSMVSSVLPEPLADKGTQQTIKSWGQFGGKVGGYLFPGGAVVGTLVGAGLAAAGVFGGRYLMDEPSEKEPAAVVATAAVVAADAGTVAVRPTLRRSRTF